MFAKGFSKGAEDALACIFSLSGAQVTPEERALFKEANPFGYILFARNCENPEQLKSLVDDLKDIAGRDCPILIDQEGGRVQRMKAPHWGTYPPMKHYGDLYAENPSHAEAELKTDTDKLASELTAAGINVNCAPCIDVPVDGAHDVIGDRAFSHNPQTISALGLRACKYYIQNGITPVIKHMPGHGRAIADSHHELPTVTTSLAELEQSDFIPFKEISAKEISHSIWAMSAHILYKDIDPDYPATLSPKIIKDTIRGYLGFEGILVGDDLSMKALDPYGTLDERCVNSLNEGCDLALYCAGKLEEMQRIAQNCPKLRPDTLKRLQKADEMWEIAA